jgi:uncharacterized RDD family membrane protein YckC
LDLRTPARPARFPLRVTACAIDYATFFAFFFVYARCFGTKTDEGYTVSGCGHVLAMIAAWIVCFPLSETRFGRTLGKWGCDLRVISVNGEPLTMGQAFVRHLFDLFDLFFFFGLVGYFVASSNPMRQRVGDLVAKTRVIEDPSPNDERV